MKEGKKIAILVALLFQTTSCSQDSSTHKELVEIKRLLVEINQKLETKGSNKTSNSIRATKKFERKGPNFEELDQITLSSEPTEKDIKEYFKKISRASSNQTTYSQEDPQVYMLAEVGNNNLELLLKYNFDHRGDFYALKAIEMLTEEKDKDLILTYLARKKDLVQIITKKGWEEDAKSILYQELRAIPHYLPTEWIQAIANLQEPCIYDDLKQYLILGSNRSWTYKAIKTLPGIELSEAVDEAWKNAQRDEWEKNYFAPIAVEFGNKEALGAVFNSLDGDPNDHTSVRYPRKYVLQYTDATGTNSYLRRWYSENKENLVFDPSQKKFIIKE